MHSYSVLVPPELQPSPLQHELATALILANYFQANVEFVPRALHKTPDFLIKNVYWELKSPTGSGKYNIQHQLKNAAKQSSSVIVDARRSKMHMTRILIRTRKSLSFSSKI